MTWFKLCLLCLLCLMLLPAVARAEGGRVSAGSRIIPLGKVAAERLSETQWPSAGFIYERVAMGDYDLWTWNGQYCTYYSAGGETKYQIEKAETVAGLLGKPGASMETPWRYQYPNGLLGILGLFAGSILLKMFRTVADSKPKTPKSAPLPATPPAAWKPAPAEPVGLQPAPVLPPPVTDPAALPALQAVGSEPQGISEGSGTTKKVSSQITPGPSLPPPSLPPPPPVTPAPVAKADAAAPARAPKPAAAPVPAAPSSLQPRTPMLALVFRPFEALPGEPRSRPGATSASPSPQPASPEARKSPLPSRPEPIFWEIPAAALQESERPMATAD